MNMEVKMKVFLYSPLLAILCGCMSGQAGKAASQFAITDNWQSDYSIVIPADGDPAGRRSLRETAYMLQQIISESGGVKIPVVNEKFCCSRPECANAVKGIYLGKCRAAVEAGVYREIRTAKEFIVCENSGNIFIAGVDDAANYRRVKCFRHRPGSAGAAAYFAEKVLKSEQIFQWRTGRNTPAVKKIVVKKGFRHTGTLQLKCTAEEPIHELLCGLGREGERFGAGFAAPICHSRCSWKNALGKKELEKFCRTAFMESGADMTAFYKLLYASCRKYPANCRRHRAPGTLVTDPGRIGAVFTPEVIAKLERHLTQAEKRKVNFKVRQRIRLIRNEFDYSKNLASIIHLYRAYSIAPDRSGFENIAVWVERYNRQVNSWFGAKGSKKAFPDWPELMMSGASSQKDLQRSGLENLVEPLKWDFNTLRKKGILPGVGKKSAAKRR